MTAQDGKAKVRPPDALFLGARHPLRRLLSFGRDRSRLPGSLVEVPDPLRGRHIVRTHDRARHVHGGAGLRQLGLRSPLRPGGLGQAPSLCPAGNRGGAPLSHFSHPLRLALGDLSGGGESNRPHVTPESLPEDRPRGGLDVPPLCAHGGHPSRPREVRGGILGGAGGAPELALLHQHRGCGLGLRAGWLLCDRAPGARVRNGGHLPAEPRDRGGLLPSLQGGPGLRPNASPRALGGGSGGLLPDTGPDGVLVHRGGGRAVDALRAGLGADPRPLHRGHRPLLQHHADRFHRGHCLGGRSGGLAARPRPQPPRPLRPLRARDRGGGADSLVLLRGAPLRFLPAVLYAGAHARYLPPPSPARGRLGGNRHAGSRHPDGGGVAPGHPRGHRPASSAPSSRARSCPACSR